ncbi:hypothetical protein B0O99DRAFT_50261 [Bisporella sp. PMI_857]|nr:hypothetical protein B0O99DRAFT_50261 [Bisporella sp. PMI_857]
MKICLICNNVVGLGSPMWPCRICSRVFHLSWIKRWVKVELASAKLFGRDVLDGWPCPQCILAPNIFPRNYPCWCGTQVQPCSLPGLPPYSCGRACSRASGGKSCCDRPCEFICHAGPCPPCGDQEPPQDLSDQPSGDKTRRPRSKRRFTEIDEPIITHPNEIESTITVDDDDDDGRYNEPQLKRKRTQISAINRLLRETKTEIAKLNPPHHRSRGTERYRLMDDRSKELRKQLLRRRNGLGDARRYILDHETETIASGYQHPPLSAVNSVITENKKEMAKVMRRFYQVHRGGMNEDMNGQATELWIRYSSLQRRHQRFMETQRYILDLDS